MVDFKKGDNAWYFDFPEDGCGGFDVNSVKLCVSKNLSQANIDYGGYLYFSYKSKEDAINAMLKRLEEIKDEL